MVAVGDVERRHAAEGGDQAGARGRLGPPERVRDAVGGDEVVERGPRAGRLDQAVDLGAGAVGQEDHAGLGAQGDDVAGAVVLLVAAGPLVLADQVALVLVDREGAGDAGLHVAAHAQPVDVERWLGLGRERRRGAQPLEILPAAVVDGGGIGIGALGQLDFGAGDAQEGERLVGGELAGLGGRHDVVGDGGDAGRDRQGGTQRAKGGQLGHARILGERMPASRALVSR